MDLDPSQRTENMNMESEPETLDIDPVLLESIESRRQMSAMDAFARLRQVQKTAMAFGPRFAGTTFEPALPEPLTLGDWTEPLPQDNQLFAEPSTEKNLTADLEQLPHSKATDSGSVSQPNCTTDMSLGETRHHSTNSCSEDIWKPQIGTQGTQLVVASSPARLNAPRVLATTSLGEPSVENDVLEWPEMPEEDPTTFSKVESWYKSLKNPSPWDRVQFERATQQEARRKERVASRLALEQYDPENNEGLQNTSDRGSGSALAETSHNRNHTAQHGSQAKKRKRKNKISADEQRRSMQLGLNFLLRPKLTSTKRIRKRRANQVDTNDEMQHLRESPKNMKYAEFDLDAFLGSEDVVAEGHENAALPACPVFTSNVKMKALTQLVASIPAADQEEAKSDKRKILEGTRKFTTRVKCDGQNGWRIKGMKTSLLSYQLLGAGFMRDREKSPEPPQGGLLCDIMGYGKTIQALANIVDGRCVDPDDPVKATLIVVPSHLVGHWEYQISKHCDQDAIGDVLIYEARHRLRTLDVIQSMQRYNVVITTYDEVRRSYPLSKINSNGSNDDELTSSWEDFYLSTVGPLHKIKFLRIILDEGHVIKNHLSTTSIAVRALTSKYKWILTGTPAINGITDLYALFNFLGHRYAQEYDSFVGDFLCVSANDKQGLQRLRNICRTCTYRRTYSSRLFGLPLVQLPDISRTVVTIEFCDIERKIYSEVRENYVANINELSNEPNPRYSQSRCFLAMILRLRMISSHLLTNQDVVKDLLTSETFAQQVYKLGAESGDPEHPSAKIARCLTGLKNGIFVPAARQEHEELGGLCKELSGDQEELVNEFKEFMNQLHEEQQWLERLERVTCPRCGMPPTEPIVTDCMHLYCEECFFENDIIAGNGTPKCQAQFCGKIIQKAALFGSVESIVQESTAPATQTHMPLQGGKKKVRRVTPIRKPEKPKPKNKRSNLRFNSSSFDKDQDTDWISACGGEMPSAKLTKIRELIQNWIEENPEVKVVIFTLSLDFVRIATMMCEREGWQCYAFTGKMPIPAREQSMKEFRENPEAKVLVASLKAGGIGLDMTMANKCILVDLWWNEAIHEQAFCRLYRIGQQKEVEIVILIVRDTIDEYICQLQLKKTAEINSAMGEEELSKRDTIIELFRMFAEVEVNAKGGITINLDGKGKQANRKG
ncbi:putative SNF2 family helicase [Aspergillus clavatus NRRL 1]|uniref:DNA repair helicase rad5,16 n=1 Tax=Aspergillus clavatus (strain ATCC 1007 / CBS 513.65 / DSM 816 / NCTC 3887 / NRRL 1 / QM 1276 / 107) TaxID=344612 RepID=A1CB16_ASPCL|nr:DNA repair helicase rad5,16 [Aspergillus clavatus NRRL 1]EAW12934.1 DNA repair helicase rad5,16 [Aspergillus clavatus NRRL 1]